MIKKLLSVILAVAVILAVFAAQKITAFADEGDSEIIMEVTSGRVLYEKKARLRRHIASLTKIMSAIICVENADIKREICVPEECCGIEGSSIYLKAGEVLTVEDLLYGLMLRSGNDCAETLAYAVFGSADKFAAAMTEKAHDIGANDTRFLNPHGLNDGENKSTAYDMAVISSYGMKNDLFRKIVGTKKKIIPDTLSGGKRVLYNKNKLLSNYDKCIGIKTGFTKKAGRCLASAAANGNMELVSVVLGCADMYEVSRKNLELSFREYSMENLCDKDTFECEFDFSGKCPAMGRIDKSFSYPLRENEKELIRTVAEQSEKASLPLKKGDKIGTLKIYLENQLLFSTEIYTIIDVGKKFDFSAPIENWDLVT